MSRVMIGSALCFGLGVLFFAGAVPLFNYGEAGQWIWGVFNEQARAIAAGFGVPGWIASVGLGLISIGGPMGLVWWIAGRETKRLMWFVIGALAYGASWMSGLQVF